MYAKNNEVEDEIKDIEFESQTGLKKFEKNKEWLRRNRKPDLCTQECQQGIVEGKIRLEMVLACCTCIVSSTLQFDVSFEVNMKRIDRAIGWHNKEMRKVMEASAEGEMETAIQHNQGHQLWRGIFKIANTCKSTKRRWKRIPRIASASSEVVKEVFAKEPEKGGKLTTVIAQKDVQDVIDMYEAVVEKYYELDFGAVVPVMRAFEMAKKDVINMKKQIR